MASTHSHPATRQDEWVFGVLGRGRPGFYVEIGAYDGRTHSNTLALEGHADWKGILAECNPELSVNRQTGNNFICRDAVVADRWLTKAGRTVMEFVSGGQFSGLTEFMSADWRDEHRRRRNPLGYVKITGFVDLLKRAKAPSIIDYLSLDTEGNEYDILEGFFSEPNDFQINLISVEFRYDHLLLSRYEMLLGPHGFVLDDIRGFDACFVNERLPRYPAYASMNWSP